MEWSTGIDRRRFLRATGAVLLWGGPAWAATTGTTPDEAATPVGDQGYRRLRGGPGWPVVVRSDLAPPGAGRADRRVPPACFARSTDMHVVDAQSPARLRVPAPAAGRRGVPGTPRPPPHRPRAARPRLHPGQHGSGDRAFWEVNTAAHVDYPRHARIVELVDNADGTLSLFTTLVEGDAPYQADYDDSSPRGPASPAREFAFNAPHADPAAVGTATDLNTELVIAGRGAVR